MSTMLANDSTLYEPRLFPEGDRMIVKNGVTLRFEVYARNDTTWTYATTLRQGVVGNIWVSTPSRGPDRRVVAIEDLQNTGTNMVTEYVEQTNGTWVAKPAYAMNLNLPAAYPSMSSDGLRLVFETTNAKGIHYASRATRDGRFDNPIPLTTVPKEAHYVFLDDNCARMSFSALATVLYVDQE